MKDGWQSTTDAATGRYVSPRRPTATACSTVMCTSPHPQPSFFYKKAQSVLLFTSLSIHRIFGETFCCCAPAGLIGGTLSHVRRDGLNRRR